MMKSILATTTILAALAATAQNPAPAPPQKEAILILNATAHLGNGQVIPNAAIGFRDGKITLVADATVIRVDRTAYPVIIDAFGKQVYPGFIDCNTTLGLTEIDLVRSTRDFGEVGSMNPNVRSLIAYNTDSKIIPTVRTNGVLLAEVVPQDGIVSGRSSVVELDAWNWEDAAYRTDLGVHVNWPRMFVVLNNQKETEEVQRKKIQERLDDLELFFSEAKAYSKNSFPEEKNLRFEAMKGLFDGSMKLFVHCDYVKEIISAINFCDKFGLKMVLVGGSDSYRVADLLKEKNIPVILGATHALPPREDDDYDQAYKLPFLLKQAGVEFALSVDGSWQTRNEMFHAGTAAAFGLAGEEAVASITSAPAKILGIGDRAGILETGKDATLFISDGDALDMRTNNVTRAFIRGREISLDNIQRQLYNKYMQKYGLKE
jgi:imidazolonepropionase-like amidohydrolase